MRVVEIFKSIDGEGKRTGQIVTFIRLAGCNLRCCYCDTTYAFDLNKATEMSVEEIIDAVYKLNCSKITLTGGEPLIHKDVIQLLKRLGELNYQINIETNGSIDLRPFIQLRGRYNIDMFFTVDYKSIYSGENASMNANSFIYLDPNKDIVKCVIADKKDFDNALTYLNSYNLDCGAKKFNIWFSPVFGKVDPADIVEWIKATGREDLTIQIQLHKIIWDPNKRGV